MVTDARDGTVARVLAAFRDAAPGIEALPVRRPAHAAVAGVRILGPSPSAGGTSWVLRSRVLGPGTIDAFLRELDLADRVRALIPQRLPRPLPAADGRRFVAADGALWTLHAALPGRIVRPWQDLGRAPDPERRALIAALRSLHDATRGRLLPADPGWIVRDVRDRLARAATLPSPRASIALHAAVDRVEASIPALAPSGFVFVHGDFHWGNLLVAEDGRVDGLIDLDWCRVSDPLEDLAYTAMMLVRDADDPRPDDLERVLSWYGPGALDRDRFRDLVLLYAFFDAVLFLDAAGLADRDRWIRLQLGLLDRLTEGE